MRGIYLLVLLLGCQRSTAKADPVVHDPLVVHEWGTFATFQGSAGALVDGLQHETESLPAFVHSGVKAHPSPFKPWGDDSLDVSVAHVGGKMETPVIYFYSKTQRRVNVRVDFTHGLMTQWWPAVKTAPPAIDDVATLKKTSLEWDVEVLPGSKPAGVPEVAATDPWSFARETSAAWVRANGESERYLFYRGLGRIALPLKVHAGGGGVALVHNCGDEPLAEAFVLDMRATEGRFVSLGALAAHKAAPATLTAKLRPRELVVTELREAVARALEAHGLYGDEARAMIKTWSRTWFAAEGTRVIYVVPPKRTDAILPLTIEPKPDALVRVLVGRHEFLTPEREGEVVALLKQRTVAATREEATRALAKLGRFLEPAVRRALEVDPTIAKSAKEVLAAFEAAKPKIP